MCTRSKNWLVMLAIVSLFSWSMVQADDGEKKDNKPEKKQVETRVGPAKHWIGVHAMPVDDALRAQLNLKDRVIVHHVMPDSPAAKAGVQTHDVLLKFADREITKLEDLIRAVDENGDKEANLVVLRGGKETTLIVKPGTRPEDEKLNALLPQPNVEDVTGLLKDKFQSGVGEDGTIVWRALGPGVFSDLVTTAKVNAFPNGVSISVNKENDQPAKIVVKKDGKTYETDENRLDVLPEEIRPHVQRLLQGSAVTFNFSPGKSGFIGRFQNEFELNKGADAARRTQQKFEVRKLEGTGLDELRKELKELRKEVEQLKDGSKKDSGKADGEKEDGAKKDSSESKTDN